MTDVRQRQNVILNVNSCLARVVPVFVILIALVLGGTPGAQGQTLGVIHNFTDKQDGASPFGGLAMDKPGNLYGTSEFGGTGNGTVFRLVHKNSSWLFTPLYSFAGGNDGASPQATVVVGPDGALYGTTPSGGIGHGTVFRVAPSPAACKTALCPWTETVLYRFAGGTDGDSPVGAVVFDKSGNLYGTTYFGGVGTCNGNYTCGVVYKLTHSGGTWTESVLYQFAGDSDGGAPAAALIFDSAGNLYGTTTVGGANNQGTVFELTPSGSGWAESLLYSFNGSDGNQPAGGLVFDSSGNLYGTTVSGGTKNGGTAYELTFSAGVWTESRLYSFGAHDGDGLSPYCTLLLNANGDLYGTTSAGGLNNAGNVFTLTPADGGWTSAVVHAFNPSTDGAYPFSSLIFDAKGDLFGTTDSGGTSGYGIVFEITP